MLKNFFPKAYQRYLSLPVLGPILDEFTIFLTQLGYPRHVVRARFYVIPAIDQHLRTRKCYSIQDITRDALLACAPPLGHSQEDIHSAATVNLLERYFDEKRVLLPPEPLSPIEEKVNEYRRYLQQVRGFSPSTTKHHCFTISQFLVRFNKCGGLSYLAKLTLQDIEDFIRDRGNKLKRTSLQHTIAHLRAFLRFLIIYGEVPRGLDSQIDTPRIYREEQFPRSLDWEIVCSLLAIHRSINTNRKARLCNTVTYHNLRITGK